MGGASQSIDGSGDIEGIPTAQLGDRGGREKSAMPRLVGRYGLWSGSGAAESNIRERSNPHGPFATSSWRKKFPNTLSGVLAEGNRFPGASESIIDFWGSFGSWDMEGRADCDSGGRFICQSFKSIQRLYNTR